MGSRRLEAKEYTVGWICALPIELAAAQEMLDEIDERLPRDNFDPNLYTLGRIGAHNVVLACLPAGNTGTQSAATVATRMMAKFISIRFGLMVGIGGGVPSSESDIQLGDVVISQPHLQHGGVVQYDFGKTGVGGSKLRTGWLNAPPSVLLQAITEQQALHFRSQSRMFTYLSGFNQLNNFKRDTAGADVLFKATYNHVGGATCGKCDKAMEVTRSKRKGREVKIYYGTIASGNQVMKDGATRDMISEELGGVLCFEMEAAGLMNDFPCLVIRGICDYADSHKNKQWQPYAAATAAACAKEILSIIPVAEVTKTAAADESGQRRIEMKLDRLARELRLGFKSPAIAEDLAALGKDIVDGTITEVDVEENKDFINEWLKKSRESGGFDNSSQIARENDEDKAHSQYSENNPGAREGGPKLHQAYCDDYDSYDTEEGEVSDSGHEYLSDAENEVLNGGLPIPSRKYRYEPAAITTPVTHQKDQPKPLKKSSSNKKSTARRPRDAKAPPVNAFATQSAQAGPVKFSPAEGQQTFMGAQRSFERVPFPPSPSKQQDGRRRAAAAGKLRRDRSSSPGVAREKVPYCDYQEPSESVRFSTRKIRQRKSYGVADIRYRNSNPYPGYPSGYQSAGYASETPSGNSLGYAAAETFDYSSPEEKFANFTITRDPLNESEFSSDSRPSSPEVTIVERQLAVSLEEIFNGVTKEIKIQWETLNEATGEYLLEDRILEISIEKGLNAGSKIKFRGVGNDVTRGPQHLHLKLQEIPHPLFKRDGNDLHRIANITLGDSITGWSRIIDTIDGQRVRVFHPGPTSPTWYEKFKGQGMPIPGKSAQRGDLLIGVNIQYPQYLTDFQKARIKKGFDSVEDCQY